MEVILALLAIPAVVKIIDLYRFLFEGTVQVRAALLTLGSWALGFGLVLLIAATPQGVELGLADFTLIQSIFLGIELGSAAGVAHDFQPPANNKIQ